VSALEHGRVRSGRARLRGVQPVVLKPADVKDRESQQACARHLARAGAAAQQEHAGWEQHCDDEDHHGVEGDRLSVSGGHGAQASTGLRVRVRRTVQYTKAQCAARRASVVGAENCPKRNVLTARGEIRKYPAGRLVQLTAGW